MLWALVMPEEVPSVPEVRLSDAERGVVIVGPRLAPIWELSPGLRGRDGTERIGKWNPGLARHVVTAMGPNSSPYAG